MHTLYLVRHAKPVATWGEAIDPGLDAAGILQAENTAKELQQSILPTNIYSSPLRRCVETALPLAKHWGVQPILLPPVGEIPPPLSGIDRQQWLAKGMQSTWTQLQASSPAGSPDYELWRRNLLNALRVLPANSIIYTHYIAINVVVGAAQGHDRVISFRPGHASVTCIDIVGEDIAIRNLGAEADVGSEILLGR